MHLPALLGIGHIKVTLELPAAGGLYRFSNVTYRGVQIGEVREVKLTKDGAEAKLTLDTSPKIPADLEADVRSVSAVGEQYVDLRPRTDSGPYLRDGSVITKDVPDDAMAVERNQQSNREGGAKRYREMKMRAKKPKEG